LFGQKAGDGQVSSIQPKGRCRVRKKLTVLVFVGLALVLVAGPALAAGSGRVTYAKKTDPWKGRKPHVISLTGRYAGDPVGITGILVTVQMTNKPFVRYRGDTVTIKTVDGYTKYYLWENCRATRISFSKLKSYLTSEHLLSINALVTSQDSVFKARRIEVDKRRCAKTQ
jgi:hypothetical protein